MDSIWLFRELEDEIKGEIKSEFQVGRSLLDMQNFGEGAGHGWEGNDEFCLGHAEFQEPSGAQRAVEFYICELRRSGFKIKIFNISIRTWLLKPWKQIWSLSLEHI